MWPSEPEEYQVPNGLEQRCVAAGCETTTAFVRVVPNHRHIGLYCGAGHWQNKWLPHEEFRQGARFEGLLPAEYVRPEKTGGRNRAFSVNERVRHEQLLAADGKCSSCGVRAPSNPKNQAYLREWLRQYRPDLHAEASREYAELQKTERSISFDNWRDHVSADLDSSIDQAIERSQLETDHLIPVRILKLARKLIESNIGKGAFAYLAEECVLPVCRRCNNGRPRNAIENPKVLENRFVRFHFGGNMRVAETDPHFKILRQALKSVSDFLREGEAVGG